MPIPVAGVIHRSHIFLCDERGSVSFAPGRRSHSGVSWDSIASYTMSYCGRFFRSQPGILTCRVLGFSQPGARVALPRGAAQQMRSQRTSRQ